MHTQQLTVIIEREGDGYLSSCPELDIASQGATVEEARDNLREAVELFFETASAQEIKERTHNEVYVTRMEFAVDQDNDYSNRSQSSTDQNRYVAVNHLGVWSVPRRI